MSKKITFITLFIAISISVNAQKIFKFGVAAGLNLSKIHSSSDSKTMNGFHGGLITEIKLPIEFGVEADLLLSTKGGLVEGFDSNLKPTDIDFKLTYLDVPIVAKLYILKVVNIQAGPQISYLLGGKFDGQDIKSNLNTMDIAAVVGLGLDVTKIHGAVRYVYGLTNIGTGDGKNNVIQISIGFWIK